jgi:pseudouridine synthase
MSQAGIASRRESETLITQGRVTINGRKAVIGDKADPEIDDVRVDGTRLRIEDKRVYIVVNKPMGVVTTVHAQEQEKRQTIREMLPVEGYLYPVGRLDADSEGLILMTNDGELAQRLTHPSFRHAKVYEVTVLGRIPDDRLDIWRRGIVLDDGPTLPVEVKVLQRDAKFSVLQVTMQEGRKRQIRRIGVALGHPVKKLVRTHFATLALGNLKPGEWRHLEASEVRALQASAASVNNRPSRSTQARGPHKTGEYKPHTTRSGSRSPRHSDSESQSDAPRPSSGKSGGSRPRRPSSGPSSGKASGKAGDTPRSNRPTTRPRAVTWTANRPGSKPKKRRSDTHR